MTQDSLKVRVLLDIRYNSAIPVLFGKAISIDNNYCGFLLYVHYYNLGRKWRNR